MYRIAANSTAVTGYSMTEHNKNRESGELASETFETLLKQAQTLSVLCALPPSVK